MSYIMMDDLGRGVTIFGHLREDRGQTSDAQWEDYAKIWAFRYVFLVSDTHARNVLALPPAEEGQSHDRLVSVDEMCCLEQWRPMRPRKTAVPYILKAMPSLEAAVARYEECVLWCCGVLCCVVE